MAQFWWGEENHPPVWEREILEEHDLNLQPTVEPQNIEVDGVIQP
jgi:hypothetical protein